MDESIVSDFGGESTEQNLTNEAPAAPKETAEVKTKSEDAFDSNFEDFEVESGELEPEEESPEAEESDEIEAKEDNEAEKSEESDKQQFKIKAPAQFDKEAKELFENAPVKLQAAVSKFMYETRRELAQQSNGIQHLMSPDSAQYAIDNKINVKNLVDNSVAWDKAIRDNPANARAFLSEYGIDPLDLVDGDSDSGEGQSYSPQQLEQIAEQKAEERVRQILAERDRQQAQVQKIESANQAVESFFKEVPFVKDQATREQLETEMSKHVQYLMGNPESSQQEILQQAYNIVVTDESLPFKSLLTQYGNKELAEKAKAKAAKAEQASKSITGGMRSPTRSRASYKGDPFDFHLSDINV